MLATMSALPKLQYPKPVVGAIALAENAVSDRSYHPSTILKSLKGYIIVISYIIIVYSGRLDGRGGKYGRGRSTHSCRCAHIRPAELQVQNRML